VVARRWLPRCARSWSGSASAKRSANGSENGIKPAPPNPTFPVRKYDGVIAKTVKRSLNNTIYDAQIDLRQWRDKREEAREAREEQERQQTRHRAQGRHRSLSSGRD
jgi:hypothetical protein